MWQINEVLDKILIYKPNMNLTDVPLIYLATAIAVVLLTKIYYYIKNRDVLPGPKGVPYLGLYPFLNDENIRLKLHEYKKVYGDAFSFTYTGRLFINVGSAKAMRELLINKSECFTEKFGGYNVLNVMLGNGMLAINGESWKVLRKFFIQRFRDYGLNTIRDNMAGPVYDSLNATIEELKSLQGKPVNIVNMLTQKCTITMRKIIFGEEGVTDEELEKMIVSYGGAVDNMMGVNMLLSGPLARLLFVLNPTCRSALKHHQNFSNILHKCVKKIESTMKEEHPTCIIEDYYKERNEKRRNNDPTWRYYTDDALVDSLLQFVGDGILGVAAFIAGFLNALLMHPEEQDKLYAELMEVVGPNRQPVLEDKSNLPYISAFMNEVLRESTIFYMITSLECTKETSIRGYRIPKGSVTLLNFWSAHHDPDTFEDPDTFNPSRYLPAPGKAKAEAPVTFGMGKRSCSGEQFVLMQSFLFLTTIVKNFKIVSSNAADKTSLNFLVSGQLELTLQLRNEN